jgi:hypothetical protein
LNRISVTHNCHPPARASCETRTGLHRKLWRDEFGVDIAEAIFKESTVTGSIVQNIDHVDMTTREMPINSCRLQKIQFKGPSKVRD